MKRILGLMFITIFLFAASCGEKFVYNEEYTFSRVACSYSEKTDLEDLNAFIPVGVTIRSVGEFENFIQENFETYSIVKTVGGQQERIYLKNELQSIAFLENNQARAIFKGETYTVTATLLPEFEEERFLVGNAYQTKMFYFKDGYVYYSIALTDDFEIRYIFDNQ